MPGTSVAEVSGAPAAGSPAFAVRLAEFEGPFDLLLSLISKHQLEVTELALHEVTDDFVAHIRAQGAAWDLDEATGFLVVAATLLDLKAARLLPAGEVEDEEDLALLEARDLLFARLLQYRAYKEAAAWFWHRLAEEARRFPRAVGLDERFAGLLPEVLLGIGPEEFARLAGRALTPRVEPTVGLAHLHVPRVSVREQAALLVDRLRRIGTTTFRALAADADSTLVVVARFLALLELYREGAVSFDQVTPLGELHVRWSGGDADVEVDDEFDESGEPAEAGTVETTDEADGADEVAALAVAQGDEPAAGAVAAAGQGSGDD